MRTYFSRNLYSYLVSALLAFSSPMPSLSIFPLTKYAIRNVPPMDHIIKTIWDPSEIIQRNAVQWGVGIRKGDNISPYRSSGTQNITYKCAARK